MNFFTNYYNTVLLFNNLLCFLECYISKVFGEIMILSHDCVSCSVLTIFILVFFILLEYLYSLWNTKYLCLDFKVKYILFI